MKDKIVELRVRIDGLAQLVNEFCNQGIMIIAEDSIPDGRTLKELVNEFKKPGGEVVLKKMGCEPKLIHPPQHIYSNLYECHKSLLLAKAWLGKVLAAIGEESPYKKDGERKSVEDIEPAADAMQKMDEYMGIFTGNGTYIQKIDWIREEIKGILAPMKGEEYGACFVFANGEWTQSMIHLAEARFHLGFELGRIKEQSDGTKEV